MEGYDYMDNNLNNNLGIPGSSDIKFDDTPAQSFDSLYGSSSQNEGNIAQTNVSSSGMNQGSSVVPNQGMAPNMNQGPSIVPNQGMAPNINQGSSVVPNQGMPSNMNQGPSVVPNQGMAPSMNQGPSVVPNQGMPSNMNQGPSVVPNQGMPSNINQGSSVVPNTGTIIQSSSDNLSNMDIGFEKMQSIEEQLSRTSQYNPEDFQQEQIVISTDNESDKSKSGLVFVIVLFVILALVIAFLPQITKLIK